MYDDERTHEITSVSLRTQPVPSPPGRFTRVPLLPNPACRMTLASCHVPRVEVRVYVQKVKHLEYEHQNNLKSITMDGEQLLGGEGDLHG